MHEIAFQADKRFAGWSVCVDRFSPRSRFILFGITFTRKIYSTPSRRLTRRQLAAVTGGRTLL